jgi:ParB-like chromosome segregation protein Spo0J
MKLKDLVKSNGGSGSDRWNVPIELLDSNPDNIRLDRPEVRDHIRALADSIKEVGFIRTRPLTVRMTGDRVLIEDGNCRLAAVYLAISEGAEIKTLPCLSEAPMTTAADRTLNMLLANSGLPHTPLEYLAAVKRLLSYGWTDTDIAKRLGRSRQWLANLINLGEAGDDVHALVTEGAVSSTQALALVRQHGSDAAQVIRDAQHRTGRAHVSGKHLRAATPAPEPERNSVTPAPEEAETPDLRTAARTVLACWDTGDLDDAWTAAIADLRRAVA